MPVPDRAVAVVASDGRFLAMRRVRDGRHYCVLPGGGVEVGEGASEAAIRELREETGLGGRIVKPLATIDHDDRRAHYFVVEVEPGPLTLTGPELANSDESNRYEPAWISVEELEIENLQPENLRTLISEWLAAE